MINSTPKKDYPSRKINLINKKRRTPSKLTIKLIMGYAAALRVYNIESLGQTSVVMN